MVPIHDSGGLSPLARGTHYYSIINFSQSRFIPAGAGNTVANPNCTPAAAVYPRWRGEHCAYDPDTGVRYGLSPLARGTQLIYSIYLRVSRFIPAGAGNTAGSIYNIGHRSVYPRWRGEHRFNQRTSAHLRGLSPLARG